MKTIFDIDKNFKTNIKVPENTVFYNIREDKFKIYGLYNPCAEGQFRRIPEDVAKNTNDGLYFNHTHTAGGRVRFKTDSGYIVLKAVFPTSCAMPHMALTGSAGFDVYVNNGYYATFVPPIEYNGKTPVFDVTGGYASIVEFPCNEMRDIIINFPLYNDVSDVFLGLEEGSKTEKGNEYKHKVPVVFYGSSITQGGCASRPGNSYQAILSRHLDFDYINIGTSGSAKGEKAISDYIKNLEMSVFVYDYDFNAPTDEHLLNTHSRMFWEIREKNPDLPIIMLTRPAEYKNLKEAESRIKIVRETFEDAKRKGDKNVYFISGMDIMNSLDADCMTVDGCHPNDFGFYCMAMETEKILKGLLK